MTISHALAALLGAVAEQSATAAGVPMSIAIVDGEGQLRFHLRMDGSLPASSEIAVSKAYTAALLRMPTHELGERALPGKDLYGIQHTHQGRIILFGGGFPIKLQGRVAGAIGISGGSVAEDMQVAQAVLDRLAEMESRADQSRGGTAMQSSHELVSAVVKQVLSELMEGQTPPMEGFSGLCDSVDEAVENAAAAQKKLLALSLSQRDKIIASIRQAALDNNERLSALAVEESGLGRYEDKIRENILCATKTPGTEDISPRAYSGDHGLTLIEYAPVGVIGALTPITNPTGTLINNTIGMLAAGNAVVFNPHPSARQTSTQMVQLLHQAIVRAGGPAGVIGAVRQPTLDTAKQLLEHPKVNMLVATGGRPVVNVVLRSGKKAIGAGAGNPPALVDETASIRKAAESIVDGASINNNIFCTCEKEVIVVDSVADALVKFMVETGKAFLLNEEQARQVTELVVTAEGKINTAFIGKDVQVILARIGVQVGEQYRLAIFEAPKDHPLVWLEQMMPVMPVVRVKDVDEGIRFAVEVEQGNRHTAIMHSNHVGNMTAFARAVQTTIFVKNGPSYAGIGLGGEGHTSFTIAGPTGEGLTSARTFTRVRRCTLVEGFRII